MFSVIRKGLTPFEAEEAYPNNVIVMHHPIEGDGSTAGDVIFVGDDDDDEIGSFTESLEPDEGYCFYILYGSNLHMMTPVDLDEELL